MTIRRSAAAGDKVAVLLRSALQDSRLSFRSRGVLAAVLSRPADWETSAERLAKESPTEGKDAIRASLKQLEATGYLVRTKIRLDTGRWDWTWNLSDKPAGQDQGGLAAMVNPQEDKTAGQDQDGLAVDGSAADGESGSGADLQKHAITAGGDQDGLAAITTGGRSTGGRNTPKLVTTRECIGADGQVLDQQLPLTDSAGAIGPLLDAYALAYQAAGGICTQQTRAVVARTIKRLLETDLIAPAVLLPAVRAAGEKRSKDIDSRLRAARTRFTDRPFEMSNDWNRRRNLPGPDLSTPNADPDDALHFVEELAAIRAAHAAGTFDAAEYRRTRIPLVQPKEKTS